MKFFEKSGFGKSGDLNVDYYLAKFGEEVGNKLLSLIQFFYDLKQQLPKEVYLHILGDTLGGFILVNVDEIDDALAVQCRIRERVVEFDKKINKA